MFRLKESNGSLENYQELNQEQVEPEKESELLAKPEFEPVDFESKKLDDLTVLKLKASYLFSQSLKSFVTEFFKTIETFLSKTFFFVIFLLNAYFFYTEKKIEEISIFFILCMVFYYVVKRIEIKKEEIRHVKRND